jgi:hypothetical protein
VAAGDERYGLEKLSGGLLPPSSSTSFNVVLNYRRDDTAGHAGRLYDALAEHFGREQVFMDIDAIEPGVDFTKVIDRAVASADAFISLIGRSWLTATDAQGRRRLDNAGDFVRLEIQTALARDVRLIPVLVQDVEMPLQDQLPAPLAGLAFRNAIEIRDSSWRYDVDRLIHTLEEIRWAKTGQPARETPPERGERMSATKAAEQSPPALVPPVASASPARPRRAPLIAAAATLGLLTLVALAVAVATLTRSDEPAGPPYAARVAAAISPVDAALVSLAEELDGDGSDLAAATERTSRLGRAVATAEGVLSAIEPGEEDARTASLAVAALAAAGIFAERVAAAAAEPSSATAAAAEDAGDAAAQAFSALAGAAPAIAVPRAALFSTDALGAAASAVETKADAQANATAAARSYVQRIDGLLTNSAETRANLGGLVAGVQDGRLSLLQARSQIAAILGQRHDLQNAVAAVEAPPPFLRAAELLRFSLAAAIEDDIAIQGWIDAWFENDGVRFERFWDDHLRATAKASAAKAAFVDEYDRVRERTLDLSPLAVGDRY